MINHQEEQIIRELRGEYKIKWLEKIIKDFVKEAISEFKDEQKKIERLTESPLNINGIAVRFGVCKATIHNWINRGIITGYKVGKNRYFTYEEVGAALSKHNFDKYLEISQ
jgi:hypothetical protein